MARLWTSSAVFVLESVISGVSMIRSESSFSTGFALALVGAVPLAMAWANSLMLPTEEFSVESTP